MDLKKYSKAREMCLKAIDLSMEYGVEDKIFGKILARLGNLDQQEGNYSSGLYISMIHALRTCFLNLTLVMHIATILNFFLFGRFLKGTLVSSSNFITQFTYSLVVKVT